MTTEEARPAKKCLSCLKELFDFNSPETYRRHLHEVWGIYLMYLEQSGYRYDFTEIAESMYFLINFLQEADEVMKKDHSRPFEPKKAEADLNPAKSI